MFVYLTKKIAIPHGVKLRVVAWNHDQGWIACGADTGLLKVLRLEGGAGTKGSNLSMNQTLEGHDKAVFGAAWSNQYRKLATTDENGLIIVWTLYKGVWFEEMINNRNQSVVRDLAWNAGGKCVCIVYEDGAVVVGGVDGKRLWGRELNKSLVRVTWSPDDKYLVFGLANGEVDLHDANYGTFITKLSILCVETGIDSSPKLTGLEWSMLIPSEKGDVSATLAICYDNGKAQLMKGESNDDPYLVDTGLKVKSMHWNPQGSIIAFAGFSLVAACDPENPTVYVQFFSNVGIHLRTLQVPGAECGGVSWEGTGLRIALAVDSYIYFANIRPDYHTAYFNSTCVYSYTRPSRGDTAVMYWNVKSHDKNVKSVRRLTHVKAAGDVCVLVTRSEDLRQHMIHLTNSIGTPLDVKYIDLEPKVVALNLSHVCVCGSENILLWQFQASDVIDTFDPVSVRHARCETSEHAFHIDDIMRSDSPSTSLSKKSTTQDLICAVELSEKYLFIGRESGIIQIYSINPIASIAKFQSVNPSYGLFCNCDNTMLALVDIKGTMTMMPIDTSRFSPVSRPVQLLEDFERKDVWSMKWASDNSEMFLTMEKTRMYIFRGTDPEEPVQSNAIPCEFENLKVKAVILDDIMADPDRPPKEAVIDFETKSLRDTRELIQSVSPKEGFLYVEDHPHPTLWSLVAEAALDKLDFLLAERAVVKCRDYAAIQFVKRIQTLDEPGKQKAEIHAYYHRFDEAEKIYKEMDRKDLALELRSRLGDWFRVVQLVQEGGGDESLMFHAWESIGDHYADRQKWSKAVQYYTQCKHYEKLSKVYYIQEDFRSLEKLVDQAAHDKALLLEMGKMFLSVGLAEAAVNAYLRGDEIRKAVDCCVELNQWDKAVVLAESNKLSDIGQYLSKYANHLVEKEKIPEAIELYRKAGQHGESAKLISKLAQKMGAQNEPLKAKKYYVLAALEVETFRKKQSILENKTASQVVDELLVADKVTGTDKSLDGVWRGAEAFHYFLTSQHHLLKGNLELALITAMRLVEYEEYINPIEIYSVVAIAAFYNKNFGLCSKAFTRLELSEVNVHGEVVDVNISSNVSPISQIQEIDLTSATSSAVSMDLMGPPIGVESRDWVGFPTVSLQEPIRKYGNLAVKMFTRYSPVDNSIDRTKCPKCSHLNKEWASSCNKCNHPFHKCILSGKAIVTTTGFWQCHICHHRCLEKEVQNYRNCPLCHASRIRL